MTFDLTRLGAWADLPFFHDDLPRIADAVAQETRPVYPPAHLTFKALERCQPDQTRVIILGQDPYHTPGKADGFAFSIPQGFGGRLDSLGNIFKELETDLNVKRTNTDLSDWADQGILLLNTALTVPEGAAKAHAKLGWSTLTRQVIARLQDRPRAYLLWGGPAQTFAPPDHDNLVLKTAHPSPLSVYRGFYGSRPFSAVNFWLIKAGAEPIDWAPQSLPE